MYWRQNLNEPKSGFWNGRAWWELTQRYGFRVEWSFWNKARWTALEIQKEAGEGEWTLHLALWHLFNLYLTIHGFRMKYTIYTEHRTIGFYCHNKTIHISFWEDPMGWGRQAHKRINLDRLIFGDSTHSKRIASESITIDVVLPERTYSATVQFEEHKYTWRRFRKPHIVMGANVEFDNDNLIYSAGKGENDYDMADDASISMFISHVDNLDDVRHRIINNVLARRMRYGFPQNLSEEHCKANRQLAESLGIED